MLIDSGRFDESDGRTKRAICRSGKALSYRVGACGF